MKYSRKSYYEKLYSKHDLKQSSYNNNVEKLDEVEQNICEGLLTEQECAAALKEMKNQKSPGSDGLTTEF